jgi:hypothetical protein
MALRFIDSCGDAYSTAHINRKWSSNVSGAVVSGGRRSTNALQLSNGKSYTKVLDNQATWTVGFSFKLLAGYPFSTGPLVSFLDGSSLQMELKMDTTGHLLLSRNGTFLVVSTNVISIGAENYIEFKTTIHPSAGTYEVRVNGSSVGWIPPATGQNTRATANSFANTLQLGNFTESSSTNPLDDLYLCDGTGAINNSFLGDMRVDAVLPSGAGSNTGMTPSAGSNFQCVDDATTANDDTDYVESSVVTTKDTYAYTDITHTPATIAGVQINMVAKKDDAGARSICSVTRSGGADTDGSAIPLSTSYVDNLQIVELDPNGSIAWTKTNLNAAEFGMKVQA